MGAIPDVDGSIGQRARQHIFRITTRERYVHPYSPCTVDDHFYVLAVYVHDSVSGPFIVNFEADFGQRALKLRILGLCSGCSDVRLPMIGKKDFFMIGQRQFYVDVLKQFGMLDYSPTGTPLSICSD